MWLEVLRRRGAWRTNVQCSMTRSGGGLAISIANVHVTSQLCCVSRAILPKFHRMTSGRGRPAPLIHH
jgi:hypothetical protein